MKYEPLLIKDILDSGAIQESLKVFHKKVPEIPKGVSFPHVNFRGTNDYPNTALEAVQLILFDVAINQAEVFL